MATFVFDGTSNISAAKTDTVVITANPATFTSVAETGGNVVFNFGGRLLTVNATTFGDNTTQYPNISLANGTFSTGAAAPAASAANALVINSTGTVAASTGGVAGGIKALFGGLGVADPSDGTDTFTIGGKGSFLVYGNAGDDAINQSGNFDSSSFVTAFGGKGQDTITLNGTNNNAKLAIYGGESTDIISVTNTGANSNTTIFGGVGAADSADSADQITFNGGGLVNIFGNAGNDTISLGATGGLDSTSNVTVHGGRDADGITIAVNNVKATIVAYGDENNAGGGANNDSITVTGNAGTTVIFGGTAAADSADNADNITYSGQGTATIYAAGGDDVVTLNGAGSVTLDSTSTTTVFGGNGADSINVFNVSNASGTTSITGGAGADSISFGPTDANLRTETDVITFKALVDGQSVTVGGLTLTATGGNLTDAQVATGFQSLAAGATTGNVVTNAVYTGTLTTGFSSGARATADVTFTSGTAITNVADLTTSTTGTALTQAYVQGSGPGNGTSTTITDFVVGAGGDKLSVQNGQAGATTFQIVDGSGAATQQAALDLAVKASAGAAGTVSGVVFQGNAFVVVNVDGGGAAGTFNQNVDLAIKLTGVTDLAALSTATTII